MTASRTALAEPGADARRRRPWAWALGCLLGAAAVSLVVPEWFGLGTTWPFAQVVAFRPLAGATLLTVAALVGLVRRVRPVGVVLALVGLLAAALVLPRTVASPPPQVTGRTLTVLSFNVYDGDAEVGPLADLIAAERPDIVVLPEAGQRYRQLLAPRTEPLGYRSWSSTPAGVRDINGVVVLAAPGLGPVVADVPPVSTRTRWLELTGGGLGAVRVVAAHPAAPLAHLVRRWASDVRALGTWCGEGAGPTVVLGDLNATLDHGVLRDSVPGCADVAADLGHGLVATWPSSWPRLLGVQIDHVLVGGGIRGAELRVLDIPGSDHRAVWARLDVP